jgi:NAD(P)-dependent dehydrogenase (short-subunit alcohol dehydrogenase family)
VKLTDRVAVVTGGASGIGEALCRRFAREGARGVVVADLDEPRGSRVADEVGGLFVRTDVGVEADVQRLALRSRERYGEVDLFCSNAGVAVGGGLGEEGTGPFAPDADWMRGWSVHVMGHVYAARAVLPAMLSRGEGYLLHTASAAGLLADMGAMAYSVTKHATVAFAACVPRECARPWSRKRSRRAEPGTCCAAPSSRSRSRTRSSRDSATSAS